MKLLRILAVALAPTSGTLPPGDWQLIPEFSDEFDGSNLNLTKWDTSLPSWGAWSWAPANVAVAGGAAALTMSYEVHTRADNKTYYYVV